MQVSDFTFDLPEHLIAQYPAAERTASRLMHLDSETGTVNHYHFADLPSLVNRGDLMVFNNTRVIPARFHGKKASGGKLEVLLERVLDDYQALVQIRSSKSPKPGSTILLGSPNGLAQNETAVHVEGRAGAFFKLRFPSPGVLKIAEQLGEIPLPPYIARDAAVSQSSEDAARYQTVYAKHEGAVAAPTAGMHFSKHLLKRLEIKGVDLAELTLHVGLGTFNPVEVEDLSKHKMDSEELIIEQSAVDTVNAALKNKRRICAVGTTVMRGLESSVSSQHTLNTYQGWTHKFIFPPFDFSIANCMITNFHTPKSTLLMMVSAFADPDFIKEAYDVAVKEKYNFYSYGDAMLVI